MQRVAYRHRRSRAHLPEIWACRPPGKSMCTDLLGHRLRRRRTTCEATEAPLSRPIAPPQYNLTLIFEFYRRLASAPPVPAVHSSINHAVCYETLQIVQIFVASELKPFPVGFVQRIGQSHAQSPQPQSEASSSDTGRWDGLRNAAVDELASFSTAPAAGRARLRTSERSVSGLAERRGLLSRSLSIIL